MAVRLATVTVDGRSWEERAVELEGLVRRPARVAAGIFPRPVDRQAVARRVARRTEPRTLAQVLAAMAHPQRLGILLQLLGGEATHKLLQKATQLKAGPLYHHIRELRAAGFIGPKVRDLYVLTPVGRRAILAALAVEKLVRQGR